MTFLGSFLKHKRMLLGGLGALVVAGVAVGVTANAAGISPATLVAAKPSPSPGAGSQACQDFLNHLAADLGVTSDKLHAAGVQAADQTIDDAVAAGKITATQAASLKQKVQGARACAFAGRFGREGGRGNGMMAARGVIVEAAAQTLKLTPAQLRTDLMQGKTLSSLAGGMTEDQFRAAFLKNLKTDLDQVVQKGQMTSAAETDLINKLQTAPVPFWSQAGRPGMMMPRGGAPAGSGSGV